MNLAALAAATPTPSARECTVGWALATLPDTDAENLVAALANPHAPSSAIGAAVTEATGHRITGTTIARHRRGDCSCA